jgi:formate-dependent nitrite reductase cytochrome c552 subunit
MCEVQLAMLKNITLSADPKLIELARAKATKENSTLNAQFRVWLERYVSSDRQSIDYDSLMDRLVYGQSGKKFSRDEMNERSHLEKLISHAH